MAVGARTGSRKKTIDRNHQRSERRHAPDYVLAGVVGVLLIVGLMAIYSATFDWSYQVYGRSFYLTSRQLIWMGIGIVVMIGLVFVPYHYWRRFAVPIMATTLLLLVLVLLFGDDRFGARRTFFQGSVQPSELAKLVVVIYVAAWLSSKGEQIRDVTYGLLPFAVLIGGVAGLIVLEPDMSTATLIALTALVMFFFAGADLLQLFISGAIGALTFFLLVNQLPHARQRIDEYTMIWRDPTSVSHHVQQILIALGSGGLFGVGLGQGQQKLGYLPTPHTDSIFAVIGEESGFLGCLLVIVLFGVFAYRGYKIAMETSDTFAALLACGVTSWLTLQALINIAVMTGLVPFTGIALPFISAGGSSMVVSLAGVGILLNISLGKHYEPPGEKGLFSAHMDRGWGDRGARLPRPGRRTSTRR